MLPNIPGAHLENQEVTPKLWLAVKAPTVLE